MKLFLHVTTLVALTVSILGDGAGEETSPRLCPVKEDDYKDTYAKITESAITCLATGGTTIKQLLKAKNLDDRKAFFESFCHKRPLIQECLAGVAETSGVCQNESRHDSFQIFRELLTNLLDGGCVRNGEALAAMVTIVNDTSSSRIQSAPFRDCTMTGVRRAMPWMSRHVEVSSRFFLLYREAINVKRCFGTVGGDYRNVSREVALIVSDVIGKMKCLDPEDGTWVPCTALDVTVGNAPRRCPIRSADERTSLRNVITIGLTACVASRYSSNEEGLGQMDDLGTARAYAGHYCDRKEIIGRCCSDAVILSSVCLNDSQHNLVKIVEQFLQNVLAHGCIDHGRHLAYVLFKAVSDMKDTGDGGYVWECLAEADRPYEGVGWRLEASRVLVFHQQLKLFKGCLINKLRGDNVAVFNAQTLFTLVERSMKCIDPDHGTIVLCETINTQPSSSIMVCPFVGENVNEPPKYEMFVGQSFKCVETTAPDLDRVLTTLLDLDRVETTSPDLDHVSRFTTLDEFQAFFNSFCRNRLAVKHCLGDLSTNSALCQNHTNHQMLDIFTDFLGTTLETGCRQEGEALATIMYRFVSGAESAQMRGCLVTAGGQLRIAGLTNGAVSTDGMLAFHAFESLKECVLQGDYEMGFKNVFATFINEILKSLKCINPDDRTTVLCQTIIVNN